MYLHLSSSKWEIATPHLLVVSAHRLTKKRAHSIIDVHYRPRFFILDTDFFFSSCSAKDHYHLAMHVSGLLTTASSLQELDDMVRSAAVVFSSPCSGTNVEKHFNNIQSLLTREKFQIEDMGKSKINSEDLKVNDNTGCMRTVILTLDTHKINNNTTVNSRKSEETTTFRNDTKKSFQKLLLMSAVSPTCTTAKGWWTTSPSTSFHMPDYGVG